MTSDPGIGNSAAPCFAALAQPGLRALKAYDPGHDLVALRARHGAGRLVELGANENPYGPSPLAVAAARDALGTAHRYPDPLGGGLKQALAARLGVAPAQLLLGNGSHELLMQFAQAFAGPAAGVAMSQYGFAVYALAAQAAGAPLRIAPALPAGHAMARGHDPEALLAAARGEDVRLLYLANPNNPTGTWIDADALARLLDGLPPEVLVVVDEAYAEFVDAPGYASALALLPRYRNLVVTRTFSKAHALAGLRVGYAVGDAALVAVMERLRESFNVNCVALAAATAALGDQAHLREGVAANARERARLTEGLRERGRFVHPSQTNFLLVEFGSATAATEAALLRQGVVVRPMAGYGLPDCLRISVGTAAENVRLLQALDGAGP
ncbi:histidinol-phosphate transaminase [Luteimonas sp. RD2P54]|uniref:Histidinol-phosphate aminotransferase n=1 Tax=Luteimonas endophytica TaxID=3042023 RepID=A0ABT6J3V4_9GAMM|nr:histidinol-phosphate transaminase [Luteimonas endophytica]MDH5821501.1 histidinol-phosphate transaminase [Luteimonas endophytica]